MTTISRNISADFQGRPFGDRGNILIYVLMTMVIFAVIGVTMVSLFSTSVSSSATANETRRAFYLSESGHPVCDERAPAERVLADEHQPDSTTNPLQQCRRRASFRHHRFRRLVPVPVQPERRRRNAYGRAREGQDPDRVLRRKLTDVVPDLYLVVASLDPRSTTQKPQCQRNGQSERLLRRATTPPFQFRSWPTSSPWGATSASAWRCSRSADQTFTPSGDASGISGSETEGGRHLPQDGRGIPVRRQGLFLQKREGRKRVFPPELHHARAQRQPNELRHGHGGHRLHPSRAQQLLRHLQGHLRATSSSAGTWTTRLRWRATPPRT